MVSGSGNKSKSKSQSTQESGTKFNQDFLDQLYSYFGQDPTDQARSTAEAKYLADYPELQTVADGYYTQPGKAYEHYQLYGKNEGRKFDENPAYIPAGFTSASYKTPQFTGSNYTGANYTPVEGGDFNRLESNLYEGQSSKLRQAYDQSVARQREELAQSGALNSPSQYLEGSARSSLDRGYLENLQAAARDAANTVLGLKQTEAARKTAFDVGQAGSKTAYDVGEASRRTGFDVGDAAAMNLFGQTEAQRQTQFGQTEGARQTSYNQYIAEQLYRAFLNKLTLALEASKYSQGQATGSSSGLSGGGSIFNFAGSNSSS